MKNTLTINTLNNCTCDCIDSVYDDSNSIFLIFITDKSGTVEFSNGQSFDITPQSNTIFLQQDWYLAEDLRFLYSDDEHVSNEFTIKKPTSTEGNMTLKKTDNFTFQVNFHKPSGGGGGDPYTLPPATTKNLGGVIVGNGLDVNESGLLSVNEVFFQSVSNGKANIAAAITEKGVPTAANATFETMAQNIKAIPSGGTSPVDIYGCIGVSGLATYEE